MLHNRLLAALSALFLLVACTPLISPFSEVAYQNATDLKAHSLALVDQSADPFAQHAAEAEQLLIDVSAAYEFVNGMKGNEISAAQWQLMRDPDGGLLGEFAEVWREQGSVGNSYRDEKRIQIGKGFDQIICLEANKRSNTACLSL